MAEPEERTWAAHAKCLHMDPAFFFPVTKDADGLPIINEKGAEVPDLSGVAEAKRFCNGKSGEFDRPCPVREECLHYAIANGIWEGVFGGMVERERRRYARQKRAGIGFRAAFSFGGGGQAVAGSRED